MDFKNYSQTHTSTPKAEETKPEQTAGLNEKDVRRAINHFSKMDNNTLMRELTKHLSAKRAQGREHEIFEVIERIKPFLSPEQRTRMTQILENY